VFDQSLHSAPIAVLDFEMTGLDPAQDRVCEVAIVRGRNGRVESTYQTLVRPNRPMSPSALSVHGISAEMLADAPEFHEIAGEIEQQLAGAILVCHNVPFDIGFLHREMDLASHPLQPPLTVDTLMIARRLFAFPRNNLATVCTGLGVPLHNAHRAMGDAQATFAVFFRMAEILDPDRTVTVRELADLVSSLAPDSPLRLKQKGLLKQAFRTRRSVWIDYKATGEPSLGTLRREVGVWLLNFPRVQAWCFLRNGERVFRLDRMIRVSEGERDYEIPTFTPRI
jgi:DNA polymerase III epsilon subunit family exonuclease